MRGFLFLTIVALGASWAFDQYEYDGRNSQAAWQQARDLGRNFSSGAQRIVDTVVSGH